MTITARRLRLMSLTVTPRVVPGYNAPLTVALITTRGLRICLRWGGVDAVPVADAA